jgi:hypothetical protein
VAHISVKERRAAAIALDQANGFTAALFIDVRDDHGSATEGEPKGN